MSRPRRARDRSPELSDIAWAMLTDADLPPHEPGSAEGLEVWMLQSFPGPETCDGKLSLEGLWPIHGREIVEGWAVEHPGTRPSCWWLWSAPRLPGVIDHNGKNGYERATVPRLRLGGIGDPGLSAGCHLGFPNGWITPWEVAYYNGRTVNVKGEPIGTNYRDGHFTRRAPDPRDPPRYESQAAYLDRHELLLPGERERLTKADFAPEVFDAQGFLDRIARDDEARRQRRIELGQWAGEPAGWTGIRD
jgi:hypothetical protein